MSHHHQEFTQPKPVKYYIMNGLQKTAATTSLIRILVIFYFICCMVPRVMAQSIDDAQSMSADTATLQVAVEASPDSLSTHEKYINAFFKSLPKYASNKSYDSVLALLAPQYKVWMWQFPRSATVPYAIGHAFTLAGSPKAKPYLLEAVRRNPKLAKAWNDLSNDAVRWGDNKASQHYMLKAAEAAPNNPDYAFSYAFSFENSDPPKERSLLYDLTKCFPKSEVGAQALYLLANESNDNTKGTMKFYEQLRTLYPSDKFDWSDEGMSDYFYFLIRIGHPVQALSLAKYMNGLHIKDDEKEWSKNLALVVKINKANQFLKNHQPADAVKILSGVKGSNWTDIQEAVDLLKAKAMVANDNTQAAYNNLIVSYAKYPHDKTRNALLQYGTKLGKNEKWVKEDIWKQRHLTEKPAYPFTLENLLTGDSISLSDYRGKAVLLSFWFPGCDPCREELPHFQKILNEFKGKDIVFLAINVLPREIEYVVPFMKGNGYSFIPLEDNGDSEQKAYSAWGAPTNFLIDGNGEIIFSGFMIHDGYEEQMLKLMLSSLLDHKYQEPVKNMK